MRANPYHSIFFLNSSSRLRKDKFLTLRLMDAADTFAASPLLFLILLVTTAGLDDSGVKSLVRFSSTATTSKWPAEIKVSATSSRSAFALKFLARLYFVISSKVEEPVPISSWFG